MLGNTIFGALEHRPIDWDIFFRNLVQQLPAREEKSTPIYFYLFHLYQSRDYLMEQEEIDY